MTIDQERANTSKFNIRQALSSVGVNVPVDTPLDEYPPYIMGLSGGGGEVVILEEIYDSSALENKLDKTFREIWDLYKSSTTLLIHQLQEDSSEERYEEYLTVIVVELSLASDSSEHPFVGTIRAKGSTYVASSWDEYPVAEGTY